MSAIHVCLARLQRYTNCNIASDNILKRDDSSAPNDNISTHIGDEVCRSPDFNDYQFLRSLSS